MTAPVVEIVVAQDTTTTDAMIVAASEGLPPSARVTTVESPSDAADVVVVVRWSDDADRRATIHIRVRDGRTAERTVSFGAADPDRERGRALGFAVAAMIPDDIRGDEGEQPPPVVEPPAAPAAAGPTAPDAPTVIAPPTPAPGATERSRPASISTRRLWLDGSAQGATGLVGGAGGLGGSIALRVNLDPIVLRIGGAARAGEVSAAGASSAVARVDAGAGFYTVVLDPRLRLGARAGVVALRHSLRRVDPDGRIRSGAHTLLGVEVMAEGSFALGSRFAVLAAIGPEVAFGTTRVLVGGTRVAVIPPLRVVGEIGIRVGF